MKHIILLLFTVSLFSSCDNEPLEEGLLNQEETNNENENPNDDVYAMDAYSFDSTSTVPIFGEIIVNADFDISNNNVVTNVDTESQFFGSSFFANSLLFRNNSGQITSVSTLENNIAQNETTLAYAGTNIAQITYDDFEDDAEDYAYTFSYNGNQIIRTDSNNSIIVTYTFNSNNRLVRKQSTDAGNTILDESLTYDGNGNCIQAVLSGDTNDQYTYSYDSLTNPLKEVFNDQYLFSLLNADYDEEASPILAQFHSSNNWIAINSGGTSTNFDITTDSENRILTRSGNYDLGDGVSVSQEELFQYAN